MSSWMAYHFEQTGVETRVWQGWTILGLPIINNNLNNSTQIALNNSTGSPILNCQATRGTATATRLILHPTRARQALRPLLNFIPAPCMFLTAHWLHMGAFGCWWSFCNTCSTSSSVHRNGPQSSVPKLKAVAVLWGSGKTIYPALPCTAITNWARLHKILCGSCDISHYSWLQRTGELWGLRGYSSQFGSHCIKYAGKNWAPMFTWYRQSCHSTDWPQFYSTILEGVERWCGSSTPTSGLKQQDRRCWQR